MKTKLLLLTSLIPFSSVAQDPDPCEDCDTNLPPYEYTHPTIGSNDLSIFLESGNLFSKNAASNRHYAIRSSTNLINWDDLYIIFNRNFKLFPIGMTNNMTLFKSKDVTDLNENYVTLTSINKVTSPGSNGTVGSYAGYFAYVSGLPNFLPVDDTNVTFAMLREPTGNIDILLYAANRHAVEVVGSNTLSLAGTNVWAPLVFFKTAMPTNATWPLQIRGFEP
jgi:hypothetical protein